MKMKKNERYTTLDDAKCAIESLQARIQILEEEFKRRKKND